MRELENLHVQGIHNHPTIDLDARTGELVFTGKSIPDNAAKVYEPVLNWVNEYVRNPVTVTNLRINLEYFNTSTSIWLAKSVKALSSISKTDCILYIHLYFNIDDYEEMNNEHLKDELSPILDIIGDTIVSIGIRIYGVDSSGDVIKESMILV